MLSEEQKDKKEYKERKREAIQQLNTKLALFEPHVRHVINALIKTKRRESTKSAKKLAEILSDDSFGSDKDVSEDALNDRADSALMDSDLSNSNSKQEKELSSKPKLSSNVAESLLQPQSFDYPNEASFGAQKPMPNINQ